MVTDMNLVTQSNAATAKIDIGTTPIKPTAAKDAELDRTSAIQAVEESEKTAKAEEEPTSEQMQKLVDDMSTMMAVMRKGLAFKIDENSGTNIVSVMDIESGDVIRQIPNEEALKLAQKLTEVTGLLMKTEA